MNARTYRGVEIERAGLNGSGIRWVAFIPGHGFLRADTLDGVRELIREYVAKPERRWWLRMGNDYLTAAKPYRTRARAVAAYLKTARELARYGQRMHATLHMTDSDRDEPDEYPDWLLELGPRWGFRMTRA
jgi:hypothetical protein